MTHCTARSVTTEEKEHSEIGDGMRAAGLGICGWDHAHGQVADPAPHGEPHPAVLSRVVEPIDEAKLVRSFYAVGFSGAGIVARNIRANRPL